MAFKVYLVMQHALNDKLLNKEKGKDGKIQSDEEPIRERRTTISRSLIADVV